MKDLVKLLKWIVIAFVIGLVALFVMYAIYNQIAVDSYLENHYENYEVNP